MANEINNINIIVKALKEALANSTAVNIQQQLNIFITEIDKYLMSLENFYTTFKDTIATIDQYANLNANEITVSYALFKLGLNKESEIKELLKTGYQLIDSIREILTKEKIQYRIATEKNGILYEEVVGIDEILSYIKVSYDSRASINDMYKLRLAIPKSSIINHAKVETITSNGSTVYSSIRRYIDGHSSTRRNRGNEYEAYRLLYAQRGNDNREPPEVTTEEIVAAFNTVRKNTASYVQGGDIGIEQIKYIGKNMPSLTSTATIRTVLTDVRNAFQNYLISANSEMLQATMEQIFLKKSDSLAEKIEIEAREKAEAALIESIQKLKIK